MKITPFLQELRRRRVVRVALIYGAAAFVVLQAADILVPALHLPAWTMTFMVVLLAIALLPALVLAWIVDLTPDGIEITPPAGVPARAAQPVLLSRMAVIVPATLLLVGVMLAAAAVLRDVPVPGEVHSGTRTASVAVLPFTDLSDDRSQEYFGDGIAEELLNTLRSADVDVASRTSSFAFKGRSMSVRQIAQELGVDHVIDGSVRKAGNRLRITAQVIDVRSDRQLWSQTFDRDADDIFRIQDEIAQAVATALRVRFAAPAAAPSGTSDAEAYDLYLLGLYYWNQRTPDGLMRALDMFRAATARDSAFARAWAGLSFTWYVLPEYAGYDATRARTLGREAAERAVRLDPASAEARTALAAALSLADDVAGALREYDRAVALDPRFPTAHHWRGILLTGMGDLAAGEAALREARRLDPASLPIQGFLAELLDMRGHTRAALTETEAVLGRAPAYRNALINAFVFGAQLGRAQEFEPRLRDYLRVIDEAPEQAAAIVAGVEEPRLRPQAVATVESIVARRTEPGDRYYLAMLLALLGAREPAIALLVADPEWYLLIDRSVFDFVRDDPRVQALQARRPLARMEEAR
jgi:adenylate cyclase